MPRGKSSADTTILQMALVGLEFEKQKLEDKIKEIRAQLGGSRVSSPAGAAASKEAAPARKRNLSAAARRRIAAAQKKRWAEHRKKKAAQGKGE